MIMQGPLQIDADVHKVPPQRLIVPSDDLSVQVQQYRDVFPVRAAHSALGADAPFASAARAGGQGSIEWT
jgi:hypothetical protein